MVPQEFLGWLVLVVTSGLAGGVIGEFGRAFLAKRQQAHDATERQADRAHQADLQADQLSSQTAMQVAERQHREAMQNSERAHAKELRRELDHATARETFVPLAEGVEDWVIMRVNELEHDEVHYTGGAEVRPKLVSPGEVLATLRHIARGHPTRQVREKADSFHSSMNSAYNYVDMWTPNEDGTYDEGPTDDLVFAWEGLARALLELLHVDEGRDAARDGRAA